MTNLIPFRVQEQLACVEREIALRERVYPKWIDAGRMSRDKAAREIDAMKAVAATLSEIMNGQWVRHD